MKIFFYILGWTCLVGCISQRRLAGLYTCVPQAHVTEHVLIMPNGSFLYKYYAGINAEYKDSLQGCWSKRSRMLKFCGYDSSIHKEIAFSGKFFLRQWKIVMCSDSVNRHERIFYNYNKLEEE